MDKHILLVDANPESVRLLEEALTSAGLCIRSARDGAAWLRAVAEEPPDLLILDLAMPLPSGPDARELLHAYRRPVILLSGLGDYLKARHGWPGGADMCLLKPVRASAVVAAARALLGGPPAPSGRVPAAIARAHRPT